MSEVKSPKIKEIEGAVAACPLCGEMFQEAVSGNVKTKCPEEGGCGRSFLVKVFD